MLMKRESETWIVGRIDEDGQWKGEAGLSMLNETIILRLKSAADQTGRRLSGRQRTFADRRSKRITSESRIGLGIGQAHQCKHFDLEVPVLHLSF